MPLYHVCRLLKHTKHFTQYTEACLWNIYTQNFTCIALVTIIIAVILTATTDLVQPPLFYIYRKLQQILPYFPRPITTQKYEYSTLADPIVFPCEMLVWPPCWHYSYVHHKISKADKTLQCTALSVTVLFHTQLDFEAVMLGQLM